MIPDFALSLSFEGIRLLHRTVQGWVPLGEVPLDSPDLGGDLVRLQKAGLASGTPWRGTKLLLPPEQVRVVSLDGLRPEDEARAALEGLTPYAVADLVIDVAHRDGRTHVAAVAKETLAEAEAFADEHGFAPVCFAASLEAAGFPGEAFFGPTAAAAGIVGEEPVLRDPAALPAGVTLAPRDPVAAPAQVPDEVEPVAEPAIEIVAKPEPVPEPSPVPETPEVVVDEAAPPEEATAPVAAPPSDEVPAEAPAISQDQAGEPSPVGEISAPMPASAGEGPEPASASRTHSLPGQTRSPVTVGAARQLPRNEPAQGGWALTTALASSRKDPRLPSREIPAATAPAQPAPARHAPAAAAPRAPIAKVTAQPSSDPKPQRSNPFAPPSPEASRSRIGGKPRYLGLVLTVILLLVLTAVALLASGAPGRIAAFLRPADLPAAETASAAAGPATGESGEGTVAITAPEFPSRTLAEPAPEVPAAPADDSEATTQEIATALPFPSPADAPAAAPEASDAAVAAVAAAIAALPGQEERSGDPAETDRVYASTGVWVRAPQVPVLPVIGEAAAPALPPASAGKALPDLPTLAAAGPDAPPAGPEEPAVAASQGSTAPEPVVIAGAPERVPPTRPAAQPAETPSAWVNAMAEPPATRIPERPEPATEATMSAAAPEAEATWTNAMAEAPAARIPDRPETPAELLAALAATAPEGVLPPDAMAFAATAPATGTPAALGGVSLAGLRPAPRPEGFAPELPEPPPNVLASYDGPRPGPRPDGIAPEDLPTADVSDALAEALAAPEAEPATAPVPEAPAAPDLQSTLAAIVQGAPDPLAGATRQAVAMVRLPDARPRNFGRVVEDQLARISRASQQPANRAPAGGTGTRGLTAHEEEEARGEAEVASSAPAVPSGQTATSVAQAATRGDAIALREINLIGVYGQPGARRALVRMENGRYLRVGVGDALDGGQVTAIGDNALNYVRRGRTVALVIPGG